MTLVRHSICKFAFVCGLLCLFIPTKAQTEQLAPHFECIDAFAEIGMPPILIREEKIRLRGKLLDIKKLKQAAIVLDVSEGSAAKFPELGEKIYLYVIDKKGKAALIERFLDPGGEITARTKVLGSHEGLLRLLQSQSADAIELVAAGEIVIRNGRVYAVSNGSGTFRGGTNHLNFATERLKATGLKIDDRTELRDHSLRPYPDPHDTDGGPTIKALRALNEPKFRAFFDECRRVAMAVESKYKSAEDFYPLASKDTEDDAKKASYYAASRFLRLWSEPSESEVWAAAQFLEDYGEDSARRALRDLETFSAAKPALR